MLSDCVKIDCAKMASDMRANELRDFVRMTSDVRVES